jgi:hypothetical protein
MTALCKIYIGNYGYIIPEIATNTFLDTLEIYKKCGNSGYSTKWIVYNLK